MAYVYDGCSGGLFFVCALVCKCVGYFVSADANVGSYFCVCGFCAGSNIFGA